MSEREKETDRQTDRQTDRHKFNKNIKRETETDRKKERERERDKQKQTERDRDRERELIQLWRHDTVVMVSRRVSQCWPELSLEEVCLGDEKNLSSCELCPAYR